ncbi:MAG: methyltransferase [Acetobacteraceae bacterium]
MHMLNAASRPEALLQRVGVLIDKGHTRAARSLLAAARRMAPPSSLQAELAARIGILDGHPDEALRELDIAIASAPEHAGLRKLRAESRRLMGDCAGAALDAADAVIIDPHDAMAKALLGVLLLDLHRPADAVACLREAVAAAPANPGFREGLAAALDATNDPAAALDTLAEGIAALPRHIGLRNAAVLQCVRRRDFVNAVRFCEEARVAGVVDACLFGLKGHALSSLGHHSEAAEAYAEALKLGPEDRYVRHLAAAAGIVSGADRAPVDYLRAVFDGYADRFESHLLALGYRVPGLIRAALQQHPTLAAGGALGPVLDMGCGTGLLAVVLSDLPLGRLTGVDVSSAMLAHASEKQLYAELREADVLRFLTDDPRRWPLIVAADVLCYFGALEAPLAAVHASLEPGGWFIFSCENLQPDYQGVVPGSGDWSLGRQGRYAHAESYLLRTAVAAGFTVRALMPETLRREADAPVAGFVTVLERGHDG